MPAAPSLEIRPFAATDIDRAGELLAVQHRAHRSAVPLLSARYEERAPARAEVASVWAEGGASGAVALRDGRAVGFLLGTRRSDEPWGANVWIETGGYAAGEPELVRDLYAAASQRWVDEGRTRHYALVPALDDHVDAWFRLGFGVQQVHGIMGVRETPWPPETRRAVADDVDALVALAPLVADYQVGAPVFSGVTTRRLSGDALRAMVLEDVADEALGELVAEQDGRIVASFEVMPAERSSAHRGLARPDGAALIGWAASLPQARGSGAGVALTEAAHAWAHERGLTSLITDWRETNLLASRFWPARGFERSFVRVYRSIP
jgi:GNAT superfamily N-acetyltransferase